MLVGVDVGVDVTPVNGVFVGVTDIVGVKVGVGVGDAVPIKVSEFIDMKSPSTLGEPLKVKPLNVTLPLSTKL